MSLCLDRLPLSFLLNRTKLMTFGNSNLKSSKFSSTLLKFVLIFLCGDIEANPGPSTINLDHAGTGASNYNPLLSESSKPSNTTAIRVGLLNVRSAVQKASLILETLFGQKLDVLVLTETWFRSDDPPAITDDIAPEGYQIIHAFRRGRKGGKTRGGGISIIFNKNLNCRKFQLRSQFKTFETLNFSIFIKGKKINFSAVY